MVVTCHICNKPARFQTPTGRWVCIDCYRTQFNSIKDDQRPKPQPKKVAEPKPEPKQEEPSETTETSEEI
ncbi:MAG: hypothetical protein PHH82_03715 [Candidatus ainarchaeum sp.]|nr:hypothetical protein [Candidatus ainarchaeum sp.]